MRIRMGLCTAVLLAGIVNPALLFSQEAAGGWKAIFDGQSLNGWTPIGDAKWQVRDGVIVADAGGDGWLCTNSVFTDFLLKCEFRNIVQGNSGVFLRVPKKGAPYPAPEHGYELQINNEEPKYATGSIENYIQRLKPVSPTPDVWHRLEIQAVDDHFVVTLDGEKVLDGRDATFKSGHIGLQYHKDSKIEFRDIKIQSLSAEQPAGIVSQQSPRTASARDSAALPQLAHTIPLPHVKGGFDLMAVDLAGRRLFVNAEDNNTTEVIDLAAGRLVHTITGMHEPKWVVYRPELNKLYIANGDGAVRVLDARSFTPLRSIQFREKANNLRYDPKTCELFVGVGKTFGAIGIVDTRADSITTQIPLANFPKQFEVEGDLIYVNVPEANHVAVVDRRKKAIVATWPIAAAKDNVPMGFDRASHRLFIGCGPGKLAVLDSSTGKPVAEVDIAPESDGVHYDAKRRRVYISCGSGSIDVLRQVDADHYEFAGRVPTAKGAATSLFVPELDRLFLAVPQREGQTAEIRVYAVSPQ